MKKVEEILYLAGIALFAIAGIVNFITVSLDGMLARDPMVLIPVIIMFIIAWFIFKNYDKQKKK